MIELVSDIGFMAFVWAVLIAVALRNLICVFQLAGAFWYFRQKPKATVSTLELTQHMAGFAPHVAVIAPAYNEELSIASSVRSLLGLHYPALEIIVVNDGSTDGTVAAMIQEFGLKPIVRNIETHLHRTRVKALYQSPDYPQLLLIDKENGRKADAVNAGISYAQSELVCVIDADSVIDPEGLLRAVQPFRFDDGSLIAVGGSIRIANGCIIDDGHIQSIGVSREWLPRFQSLEYFRAFLCARVTNAGLGSLILISGAFGVFRWDLLVEIGGYHHDTVGEDLEVLVRLQRHIRETQRNARVEFLPEICCWTEAPSTWAGLRNQRSRWQQGALETLVAHRRLLFNPRFGRLGLVAMPMVVLEDLIGPLLELLGYLLLLIAYFLGILSVEYALLFIALTFVFGTALSAGGLIIEEWQLRPTPGAKNLGRLIVAAVFENFGYRQAIQFFRVRGIWLYLRGNKDWAAVPRVGFTRASANVDSLHCGDDRRQT